MADHDPKLVRDLADLIGGDHWWERDHSYGASADSCQVRVARTALDFLAETGRLLPPDGEATTQREWPRFGGVSGTRTVITWPDGSSYRGPFVPDPPSTPEQVEALRSAVWERVRRVLPESRQREQR